MFILFFFFPHKQASIKHSYGGSIFSLLHLRFCSPFGSPTTHSHLKSFLNMRSLAAAMMISSSTQNPLSSSSSHTPASMNYSLISALVAFALAQSIKVFITWYKEHRWDPKRFIGSGGMPSSHSATVTALAVAVGLQDGVGASTFATALILACIVMYDATGVRLQAGRQAEVLNQIVYELPAEHPLAESLPLHELLGHTPPQVIAGGLLGMMTSTIIYLISRSGNSA